MQAKDAKWWSDVIWLANNVGKTLTLIEKWIDVDWRRNFSLTKQRFFLAPSIFVNLNVNLRKLIVFISQFFSKCLKHSDIPKAATGAGCGVVSDAECWGILKIQFNDLQFSRELIRDFIDKKKGVM